MNDYQWKRLTLDEKDRFLCNCDYIAAIVMKDVDLFKQCIASHEEYERTHEKRKALARAASQKMRDKKRGVLV